MIGLTQLQGAEPACGIRGASCLTHHVIVYEALLKSLFANCRAIGFCLYDRERMPLKVINGALATHPVAGSHGHYSANRFYDPATTRPTGIDPAEVLGKLAQLDRWSSPPSKTS